MVKCLKCYEFVAYNKKGEIEFIGNNRYALFCVFC